MVMMMMMPMVWRFDHIESSLAKHRHWNHALSSLFVQSVCQHVYGLPSRKSIFALLCVLMMLRMEMINITRNTKQKLLTLTFCYFPLEIFRWPDEKSLLHTKRHKRTNKMRFNQWHKWSPPTTEWISRCSPLNPIYLQMFICECDRIELNGIDKMFV